MKPPCVSSIVLLDAVGIDVPDRPVADYFAMTMDEVFARTSHDPEPFRIDPTTLPPTAQVIAAGNRVALAAYTGTSIPAARFQLLPDTGHAPQQETPDQVLRATWDDITTRQAAATGE